MAQRTGIWSLIYFTKKVCEFIARYGGRIKELTPGNATLHDALDAANIACAALNAALILVQEPGD